MAAETELFYTQFINRTNNTGRSATDYEIKIGTGKMVTFRLDEGDFAFNAGTLPASDLRLFNSVVTNGASIGFTIAYEGFNGASFTSNWSAINQTTGLEENSGNDITIGQTNNDSASLPNGTSSPVMTFINPSQTQSAALTGLAFATNVTNFNMFINDPNGLSYTQPINLLLAPGAQVNMSLGSVASQSMIVTKSNVAFDGGQSYQYFAVHAASSVPDAGNSITLLALGCLALAAFLARSGETSGSNPGS